MYSSQSTLVPSVAALVDGNNVSTAEYVPPAVMQHAGPAGRNYSKPNVYDGNARTHTQLRDSYENSSVVLDYAIRGMILEAPEAFVTIIYPAEEAEEINYTYNSFKFNHVYVPEVPEEGVPRVVTAERRQRREKMKRRALAIRGEVTAMSTAMGVEEFTLRARGMALCIVETMIMDTMFEIVYSGSLNLTETNLYGADNVVSQATREKELTASLNRDPQQLANFVLKFRRFLANNRRVQGPYALIFPPETAQYIQSTNRQLGKDEGYDLKKELAGASELSLTQPIDFVMGMPVYEAPDLYIGSPMYGRSGSAAISATAQMLTRHKVTAEHYLMSWGDNRGARIYDGGVTCKDEGLRYHTTDRDIFGYDADEDEMVRVSFHEGVLASHVANPPVRPESDLVNIDFKPEQFEANQKRGALLTTFYDSRASVRQAFRSVQYAAQFDGNVFHVRDLRQAASSVLGGIECAEDFCTLYQKTVRLLKMLEAVRVNQAYVAALLEANRTGDTYLGETPVEVAQDAAVANGWESRVQFKGAEAGGMILPAKTAAMGDMNAPAFLANWTGLKQLEFLHHSGTRGWSEEVCRTAAEVVPSWERLQQRLLKANPENPLVNDRHRFAWEASAEPGAALFATAFGSRIPVFLTATGLGDGTIGQITGVNTLSALGGRGDAALLSSFQQLSGQEDIRNLAIVNAMVGMDQDRVRFWYNLLQRYSSTTAEAITAAARVITALQNSGKNRIALVNGLFTAVGKLLQGDDDALVRAIGEWLKAPTSSIPTRTGKERITDENLYVIEDVEDPGFGVRRTPYTASPAQVNQIMIGVENVTLGDPATNYNSPKDLTANEVRDLTEMLPLESSERFTSLARARPAFAPRGAGANEGREEGVGEFNMADEDAGALFDHAGYADNTYTLLREVIDAFETPNALAHLKAVGNERDGIMRVVMTALLGFRVSDTTDFEAMLSADVHLWFLNILLVMPAAEFVFDSAVLMKPGSSTGVNLFGHQSMMYGANAIVQNFVGSYALYTKAFTKEEDNIICIMDWRVRGYIGGANMRLFKEMNIMEEIEAGVHQGRAGLIAYPLAMTETDIPIVISPSGFFESTEGLGPEHQGAHFSSAEYYNEHVYKLHPHLTNRAAHMDRPFQQGTTHLPIVSMRGQWIQHTPGVGFRALKHGRSWRETGCYPGALAVYNGDRTYFPKRNELDEYVFAGMVH